MNKTLCHIGRCPACGRLAPLVLHHDRAAPHGRSRAELAAWRGRPQPRPRFAPVRICRRCNAVDQAIRRKFGLPEGFSMCMEEISLVAPPGRPIDYNAARLLVRHLRYRGILPPGEEQ